MAGSPWSSSSSCTSSFGSLDDDVVCVVKQDVVSASATAAEGTVKFLCSYGGRILPRHTDGALRYVGGDNRVLSVDRSLPFYGVDICDYVYDDDKQIHRVVCLGSDFGFIVVSILAELQRKLREMCGWDVSLRCQLPTEDLDALVSVTSDDDLANLLEEYDAAGKERLQQLKIRAFLFPRAPAPSSLPPSPPSVHLHRRNSSPAPAGRVSPTCAPRWWAAPIQASRPARAASILHQPQARPHRYLVHNGSHWH